MRRRGRRRARETAAPWWPPRPSRSHPRASGPQSRRRRSSHRAFPRDARPRNLDGAQPKLGAPISLGERFQSRARRPAQSVSQNRSVEALGNQLARQIGIAEKRDRVASHPPGRSTNGFQHLERLLGKVGQAIEHRHSRAALESAREMFRRSDGIPTCRGDARSGVQSAMREGRCRRERARRRLPLRIDLCRALDRRSGRARRKCGRGSIASAWRSQDPTGNPTGTISVAICPGARLGSAIACAAVSAGDAARAGQFEPMPETGDASETISEVSGASASTCHVAWSPIKLTIGECARRALCRFAMPLAKPGPRCISVIAGLSAIRP